MWVISQLAVPHAVSKPANWWAVVIKDTTFAKCGKCVDRLMNTITTELNPNNEVIQRMVFSELKRSLYIWTYPEKSLDTTRLKEILQKEGVRSYEILH